MDVRLVDQHVAQDDYVVAAVMLGQRVRIAGERRKPEALGRRARGYRGDVVHHHTEIRTPGDDVRHEVAACATDVEHASAGRRDDVDDARQMAEYAASRHAKVFVVLVDDVEVLAHDARVEVHIAPHQSALAALEQANERTVVDILPPRLALRPRAAVGASTNPLALDLLESVSSRVSHPARVPIEAYVAFENRPVVALDLRHRPLPKLDTVSSVRC